MPNVKFKIQSATIGGMASSAVVLTGEDPLEAIVEQVVQDLSIQVMVTVGGVTTHLAAWQDPDHWEDDWRELAGDEDPDTFIANAIASGHQS